MKQHAIPGLPGLVAFALIVVTRGASASTTGDDTNNFRPDVLACENAVSHLQECCPGFVAGAIRCVNYDYTDSGCDTSTTYTESPTFDEAQASCIEHMDCGTLVSSGVCKRAQVAKPAQHTSGTDMGESTSSSGQDASPPVCP
jgi:hypothetical protein